MQAPPQPLLNARDVQQILHVDRSTVYRMAETGRLPAVRVGSQWRFPAAEINALVGLRVAPAADGRPAVPGRPTDVTGITQLTGVTGITDIPPGRTDLVVATAAALLDVMMVGTDMHGRPVTEVAHPCPWFVDNGHRPDVLAACAAGWADLARLHDLQPRFRTGPSGFECARAFVRLGDRLVGMVLAGGLAPDSHPMAGCYQRSAEQRARILDGLPIVAQLLSHELVPPTAQGGSS